MLDSMTAAAAAEGLDFRFDRAVAANTFEAHQLIHLAAAHGRQDEAKERLLRAYFTEGEAVGDREVLVRLGAELGLDAEETREALEQQRHAAQVRDDEAEATALGIRGVPFFVRRPHVRRVRRPARRAAAGGAAAGLERDASADHGRDRRRVR